MQQSSLFVYRRRLFYTSCPPWSLNAHVRSHGCGSASAQVKPTCKTQGTGCVNAGPIFHHTACHQQVCSHHRYAPSSTPMAVHQPAPVHHQTAVQQPCRPGQDAASSWRQVWAAAAPQHHQQLLRQLPPQSQELRASAWAPSGGSPPLHCMLRVSCACNDTFPGLRLGFA